MTAARAGRLRTLVWLSRNFPDRSAQVDEDFVGFPDKSANGIKDLIFLCIQGGGCSEGFALAFAMLDSLYVIFHELKPHASRRRNIKFPASRYRNYKILVSTY